ncbi:unnamed protein product [Acidithrix sp. C25]|nr:unnamed protein product [Acidithrix sp. C25]
MGPVGQGKSGHGIAIVSIDAPLGRCDRFLSATIVSYI